MMTDVRWGIIGCGDVTEVKSGPALRKADGSSVAAVMRRDGAKAADYARRHGIAAWYDDAAALLADPHVNAVYVATPPSTHAEYCLAAAAAGKPVYVEKPMARTADECRTMIAACAAAGVPLFVAYYRRCLPRFVKVKQLLDDGSIGEVRSVSISLWKKPHPDAGWRVDPLVAGGGLFVDLASHTLDLLDHLCGPLVSAGGSAVNLAGLYAAEDTVAGVFAFESGVNGVGTWSFAAGVDRDVVEIVGSNGLIRFSTFGERPVEVETDRGTAPFAIPHPPHVQQPLIQRIVDELLGRGESPSTGETALRTSIAIDAMLAGWRQSHPLSPR